MIFSIFVLFLFISSNNCGPAKGSRNQVNNVTFNTESLATTRLLLSKSTNNETGRIELLETPDKLDSDRKLYRLICLNNGLKALLISTQENELDDSEGGNETVPYVEFRQTLAACNLGVDAGSTSDPRDVQGLAHFIEHMVFKGSEKYPGEIDFYEFTRKAGGDTHARTHYYYTEYGFEAYDEYLDETLDRFSQFFKAPLMPKESLLREREAVDSEFALKKTDNNEHIYQMVSSLGEKTHPSSVFQCGNLKTLKENIDDDELYRKAQEFRKRHYSAHRMYLSLQSNRSLDNLQKLVVRHFAAMPNNNMPGVDFSSFTHLNAFQPKFYENVFYVEPIKSGSIVIITWCLEPELKKFDSKTTDIVSYYLGHEGKGSLLSYLRKKLWATELYAGDRTDHSPFSLFNIDIRVTENGFNHLDDLLAAVFSYVKFLQHAKLNEKSIHEMQTALENVWRYARDPDAFDNVKYATKNMLLYPSKIIMTARYHYFNYDADAVKRTIDHLNSRKFNIMITLNRSKGKQIAYNSTEPRFGIKYLEMEKPAKWIESHQNVEPFPEYALPVANPFITDNFTILNVEGTETSAPYSLIYNETCKLWYRRDKDISRPYAEFDLYFLRPLALTSIDNIIQMTLMASWLNFLTVEELYAAWLVGIQSRCSQSQSGILFKVTGFNQKMHLVFDIFGKALESVAVGPTEAEFEVFVDQQLEIYEKDILNSELMAEELLSSVLQSQFHPLWEKYKRLRSISFSDFQQFCRTFCEEVKIEAKVHGNFHEDDAVTIVENIANSFQCDRSANSTSREIFEESIANELPNGARYLRIKNFNLKDDVSTIKNFYQFGPESVDVGILLYLMDLLDIIAKEPIYDMLRNKEELAYYVSFDSYSDLGNRGYTIIVNSQETKFSADHVDQRIEHFRQELLSIIEQLSSDDFEMFKKTLAMKKWTEHDKRVEGFQFNWFSNGELLYEFTLEHIKHLMNITKAQLLKFYRTHLDAVNQRKLSIQVIGNAQADESDGGSDDIVENFETLTHLNFTGEPRGILIEDVMEFRNSLEAYNIYGEEDDEEDFGENMLNGVNARAIADFEAIYYCWFLYGCYIFC